jgi:two-component system chemotaxis response regulator CheB
MAGERLLRVLLAGDAQLTQPLLHELIDAEPDMVVVGATIGARETVEQVERARPDLVIIDVALADGCGVDAARSIMAQRPTPIALLTATPIGLGSRSAFDALGSGAVEVLAKPQRAMLGDPGERGRFVRQLRRVAAVGVIGFRGWRDPVPSCTAARSLGVPADAALIAIGASTGGPPCIRTILAALDADSAPPVLVVQHMSDELLPSFAAWLHDALPLPVLIARDGVPVRPGHVYVAPGDRELTIDAACVLRARRKATLHVQRPAVDVLFQSIAQNHGARAIGVLLTGIGADGAVGLRAMRDRGAFTVAQDEASCTVFGMPQAAGQLDAAVVTANPVGIAWLLSPVVARPSATDGK